MVNTNNACPFCQRETLAGILAEEEDRIWLENKYRTLDETYQTVIIEAAEHDGDISTYPRSKNRAIFNFALKAWKTIIDSGKYKSVLMYKNFGPYSGGSLRHPHMQIVGLNKIDAYANIRKQNFTGHMFYKDHGVKINISAYPIAGFTEFNIILLDAEKIEPFADIVQTVVNYILNDYFKGRCTSYNLFFYYINSQIVAKIVPRFVVSPYFMGYKIPQVNDSKRNTEIEKELATKLAHENSAQ
ncbi:hypothetical protein FC81_GL001250 [Liquorilactobacillus capillatus DSM 19910]|uniref:Galactose-1-phosphate uridylyltransferase n=1 Tax=Liquorilactobacillus capillatus DSM 19910 TaxID=1423731 RepID=A0A0R1LZP5_9LACO|nr:hypothetical protein FC81_GL001250 [Liquorilactobacillus capillatus DSM 19910]